MPEKSFTSTVWKIAAIAGGWLFGWQALFVARATTTSEQQGVILISPSVVGSSGTTTFPTYLTNIFTTIIAVSAVLAVLMFVIAGIQYTLSAIPGIKEDAVGRMKGAIWGLIIVLGAILLLKTINPQIVSFQIGG